MSSSNEAVVVDVGSSRFRYGRADARGPTEVRSEPTRADALEEQLVEAVAAVRAEAPGRVGAVSVSTTGLVDADRGVVVEFDAADGDTVRDVRFAAAVEEAFGLPTLVENDCTAAVVGESRFGAGRGRDSIVYLTFGTGIGAGVVERGRPLRGERGYAAEVGLLPVVADGELRSSGVRGAWEAYCSGRGIPRFVEHMLADDPRESVLRGTEDLAAPDVFAAAADGDAFARSCLDRIARYNAAGVGAVVNAYDPGAVTLGGSVALCNSEWMLSGVRQHLDDYVLANPPEVRLTTLGEDVELYGAAAGAFDAEMTVRAGGAGGRLTDVSPVLQQIGGQVAAERAQPDGVTAEQEKECQREDEREAEVERDEKQGEQDQKDERDGGDDAGECADPRRVSPTPSFEVGGDAPAE